MSDNRGRIVGTKLNLLEQLSMCMCGSFSHHYHLMHTSINNAVWLFFGMKPEYKEKQKITPFLHVIPFMKSFTLCYQESY
jgi:hypothetical protein